MSSLAFTWQALGLLLGTQGPPEAPGSNELGEEVGWDAMG